MYTDVDSKYGGSRPRSLKVMALMASLSMAMVGLVGLGLAAPASADTAPACPADTIDTTWELVGNVCVGTTTETAPSEEASNTWVCPEGYSSDTEPVTSESVCSMKVDKVQDYKCPSGYSTSDNPVTKDSDCTKEVTEETDATWTCPDGYELIAEKGKKPKCKTEERGEKIKWTDATPTCEAGWTLNDDMCTRPGLDHKSSVKDGKSYCPDSMQTRDKDHDDDGDGRGCTVYADPINVVTYACPEGFSSEDDPITSETTCMRETIAEETATCPVAGDVLTNLGDEEAANWQCVTPATPAAAGGAAVFTASATASGSQDICLVDGVTTVAISYDETGTGSGPTTGDAEYLANVATVAAVNAAITAQTPEGATLGACGAPITEVPVVVNPVAPATVPAAEPEAVAVPAAATVPTAVAAGGGSQAPAVPTWALALAIAGVLGAAAAGSRLVTTKK
jgi:hypothetical protein